MSQEDYINSYIRSGKCAVCEGELKKGNKITRSGGYVYFCVNTRSFPWACRDCDHYFHLDQYFPTTTPQHCPSCGSDYLMDAHTP